MAWIESHQSLRGHPKARKLCRLLRTPLPAVIGHLHLLWWWTLDYANDGDISRFDAGDIADAAQWEGEAGPFEAALVECGFLERDGTRVIVHHWDDYAGRLIAERAANAERQREWRKRHGNVTVTNEERNGHVSARHPATVPNPTVPTQPTEPFSAFVPPVVGHGEAAKREGGTEKERDFLPLGNGDGTPECPAVDEVSVERLIRALRAEYVGERPPNDGELAKFREVATDLAVSQLQPEDVKRLRSAIHDAFPKYPTVPVYVLPRYTYLLPKPVAPVVAAPEEIHGPPAAPEVAEKYLAEMRERASVIAKRMPSAPMASREIPEVVTDRTTIERREWNRQQMLRQADAWGRDNAEPQPDQ